MDFSRLRSVGFVILREMPPPRPVFGQQARHDQLVDRAKRGRAGQAARHRHRDVGSGVHAEQPEKAGCGRLFSLIGLARFTLDQARDRVERELVALRPQPADHPVGGKADIGMMAKTLAPEDVRQMHLDDRQPGRRERVEYRDRGVGQSSGVENNPLGRFSRRPTSYSLPR